MITFHIILPEGESLETLLGFNRSQGVSKDSLEKLEKRVVDDSEDGSCCVCLNDFEQGKELTRLPCKHEFCTECAMPWLEKKNSCPLCRSPVEESRSQQGQQPLPLQQMLHSLFRAAASSMQPPHESHGSEQPPPSQEAEEEASSSIEQEVQQSEEQEVHQSEEQEVHQSEERADQPTPHMIPLDQVLMRMLFAATSAAQHQQQEQDNGQHAQSQEASSSVPETETQPSEEGRDQQIPRVIPLDQVLMRMLFAATSAAQQQQAQQQQQDNEQQTQVDNEDTEVRAVNVQTESESELETERESRRAQEAEEPSHSSEASHPLLTPWLAAVGGVVRSAWRRVRPREQAEEVLESRRRKRARTVEQSDSARRSEDLAKCSVRTLKSLLDALHIDYSGCIEKQELVNLLSNHLASTQNSS